MNDVVKLVNWLRSHGLHHRELETFLREVDAEYGDIPFYAEIRWLSKGKVLKRVFDLKSEIVEFTKKKSKDCTFFDDPQWMADFGFLVDITNHLNILNDVGMQGRNHFVHNLYDQVKAFEMKLLLWKDHLKNANFAYFPAFALYKPKPTCISKYVDAIETLRLDFQTRFADFRKNKLLFQIFSAPFFVDAKDAPI